MLRIQSLLMIASLAACWRGTPAPVEQGGAASGPQPAGAGGAEPRAPVLSPAVVFETITTSYLGHLKRCYTARLKRDGSASGRVIVTFTVDGKGRLSEGRASGVAKQIESCVERAMTRWEFPPAKNPDGTPSEATFRLALQLTSV